jgi:hypothetical protein
MKKLIVYRMHEPYYIDGANPKTLSVTLREDNTLSYSYYGGWQDSGMGFSMSNMQLGEPLPIAVMDYKGKKLFKNVEALDREIRRVLNTGVERHIKSQLIINEIF